MANAPLLRRRRQLIAKIETTPYTQISMTGTNAAFNAFDATIQQVIGFEDREGQAGFSQLAGVPGGRMGRLTFTTELTGGASDPSWISTFLPACGFPGSAGVYSPSSLAPEASGSSTKTLTIGLLEDGLFKCIYGAMGNAVFRFPAGGRCLIDFDFMGVWADPIDSALVAPTYPTAAPLTFRSSTFTIGSATPLVSQVTLDLGNQVIMREDATNGSGYKGALIVGRTPKGTLDPEARLVADWDVFGIHKARTEAALVLEVGTTGNKIAIAAPKLQITDVQESARNDNQIHSIAFQLNRSASAGDDELTFTRT